MKIKNISKKIFLMATAFILTGYSFSNSLDKQIIGIWKDNHGVRYEITEEKILATMEGKLLLDENFEIDNNILRIGQTNYLLTYKNDHLYIDNISSGIGVILTRE